MRRARRHFLRWSGLLVLLVALLGGLAAMGWLPPFNRWVEQRLLTELRELGIETFDEYHARFFGDAGHQAAELEHLLNLATTNKTDFFREPDHFDVLAREVLPAWLRAPSGPVFAVWCAGCAIRTGSRVIYQSCAGLARVHKGERKRFFKQQLCARDIHPLHTKAYARLAKARHVGVQRWRAAGMQKEHLGTLGKVALARQINKTRHGLAGIYGIKQDTFCSG